MSFYSSYGPQIPYANPKPSLTINNNINTNGQIFNTRTLMVKSNKLIKSSGTLYVSKRSKYFNKVLKNGKKIRNIDINNDIEDLINNEDTDSVSTVNSQKRSNSFIVNSNKLRENILSNGQTNIINNENNNIINENFDSEEYRKLFENKNPLAKLLNRFLDWINPNINKHQNMPQPMPTLVSYNQNEIINPLMTIPEVSETSQKTLNKSFDDLNNLGVKKISNNENNIQEKAKENSSNNNNNSKLSSQPSTKNNDEVKRSGPRLNQLDKSYSSNTLVSERNERKSSLNSNQEEDQKSKTSKTTNSRIPLQPLRDVLRSPKSQSRERSQSDSFIMTHLDQYIQNGIRSRKMTMDDIIEKERGFKACRQLTQAGKDIDGRIKTDQDTPLISLSIGGILRFNLFGVLDGHGTEGHFVSQFCRDYFINSITSQAQILKSKGITSPEQIYQIFKNENFNFIVQLFNQIDSILLMQKNKFDAINSGTTCNLVLQLDTHLICFNVGDSRGILIANEGNNFNSGIIPLSVDHKPNLNGELERIVLNGGVVDYITDMFGNKVGPPRVFQIGSTSPGLAMSRSLGDLQAKECGVISTPQIIEYQINQGTECLVIASDGIWEFISNEQVRDIAELFYSKKDISSFCNYLIKYAMNLWEKVDIVRDDITVVSVFF